MLTVIGAWAPSSLAAVAQSADANTLVLWNYEETVAPAGFPDVSDDGPLNKDGDIANDGIDRTPKTVELNVAGVFGSGISFQGLANSGGSTSSLDYRATVTTGLSTSDFAGGDFTLTMWVTNINNAELAGADATFGRKLANQNRLGDDWLWSLHADGGFHVRVNRAGSGTAGDANVGGALTWDDNTWYFIALVADTSAAGAGLAQYTVYRGVDGGTLDNIGSVVLPELVTDGEAFAVGSSTSPGLRSRTLDFNADESHLSNIARSESYLAQSLIPEPGPVALIGFGLLLMMIRRRRLGRL